jgi:hypothetical protein
MTEDELRQMAEEIEAEYDADPAAFCDRMLAEWSAARPTKIKVGELTVASVDAFVERQERRYP